MVRSTSSRTQTRIRAKRVHNLSLRPAPAAREKKAVGTGSVVAKVFEDAWPSTARSLPRRESNEPGPQFPVPRAVQPPELASVSRLPRRASAKRARWCAGSRNASDSEEPGPIKFSQPYPRPRARARRVGSIGSHKHLPRATGGMTPSHLSIFVELAASTRISLDGAWRRR